MTEHSPITPPPELVKQWVAEIWHEGTSVQVAQSDLHIAARAAKWGADQELEATLAEVSFLNSQALSDLVRARRRPKPPSLKEQALIALDDADLDAAHENILRRALEALPDE